MADRSPLGERLRDAAKSKVHEFEIQDYFALGHEVTKIGIRVPTRREQELAIAGARTYLDKLIKRGKDEASDPEFWEDTKGQFIVSQCCIDPSNGMRVWPDGSVVANDLTPDQIGMLISLINEVRAKESPAPLEIDDDTVEAFVKMSVATAGTNIPDGRLAMLPHAHLTQLFVLVCLKLVEARMPPAPEVVDVQT